MDEDQVIEPQPEPNEAEASELAEEVAEPAPAEPTAEELTAKKENRVQKRIDEITREKHEARQEAEYWKQQALKTATPEPPPPPVVSKTDFIPPGYDPKPILDQFEDWDQYNEAMIQWNVGKVLAVRDYQAEQRKATEAKQTAAQNHKARMEAAKGKYDDFDEVVASAPDISFPMQSTFDAIAESEQSADLVYYFSSKPEEAARINALSPVQQIKEIAKLETKFAATDPKPIKRVTQAPQPINAIESGDAVVDIDKLEGEEWLKAEKARLAKLGRRY